MPAILSDHADAVAEIRDRLSDGQLAHIDEAGHCVVRSQYEDAFAQLQSLLDSRATERV